MEEPMSDEKPGGDQDARRGGYGDSTGGQDPNPERDSGASSAAGREDGSVSSPVDADEALGNRSGGYGSSPMPAEDPTAGADRDA
jgi:hypothetical protein